MAVPKKLTGRILDGSNNPISGVVQAQMKTLAFVNNGEVVPRVVLAIADATGNYAFDPAAAVPNGLYSNADMTPANSYWTIQHVAGGVPYPSFAVVIPNTAGPFAVTDPGIVVSSPALPAQYIIAGAAGIAAADGTIVIGGTVPAPTIKVGTLAQSQVTGLPAIASAQVADEAAIAALVQLGGSVRTSGAKGDAKTVTDGAILTGTPTFTSATAGFVGTDAGKLIMVAGAGPAGAMLSTTILAYVNATTVTLAANAAATVAGAATVFGADDTAALNAAVAATPPGGSLNLYGQHMYFGPLVVPGHMTLQGRSVASVFADVISSNYTDGPHTSPYLTGDVLIQCTPGADGVRITGTGTTVNLKHFGIRFPIGIAFKNTGHGVYAVPTALNGLGHENGCTSCQWENVVVYGHDGNHYAFYIVNPNQGTYTHLRGHGGGGLWIECDSTASAYGNSVFIGPYFEVFAGGTAHGYALKAAHYSGDGGPSIAGWLNVITFIRPQSNITPVPASLAAFGITPPTVAQYLWRTIGRPQTVSIYDPDLEGYGYANPIDFGPIWQYGALVRDVGGMGPAIPIFATTKPLVSSAGDLVLQAGPGGGFRINFQPDIPGTTRAWVDANGITTRTLTLDEGDGMGNAYLFLNGRPGAGVINQALIVAVSDGSMELVTAVGAGLRFRPQGVVKGSMDALGQVVFNGNLLTIDPLVGTVNTILTLNARGAGVVKTGQLFTDSTGGVNLLSSWGFSWLNGAYAPLATLDMGGTLKLNGSFAMWSHSAPVAQPGAIATPTAAAVAAAVTAATNAAPYGYSTAAQADAIRAAVNQLILDNASLKTAVDALRVADQVYGITA